MRIAVTIGCSLALLARGLPAQSNADLMKSDRYTRRHDYDLLHQQIVLSSFNWGARTFDGRVTTQLVAARGALDSVIIDEGALLINISVTTPTGASLRTARRGDTLVVFPLRRLNAGDTLTFAIAYHAKIANGHGLTFITSDGLPHRPEQIWSQGEDHDNHYWFPTYDFPNDKMTWELIATVPAADVAVSNGRLVSDVVDGGNRTMTWRQESLAPSYLVSLVVAPLAHLRDTGPGNLPLDYFVYHEDSTFARPLFRVTGDMIAAYARLTGVAYPWAKYAQTTVADFFGGMENVSATTLVDWLPDARSYADRPWYQYTLIPHELAHQWFGDYVTTANWANTWLNEGFAEFMPGQYWNEKLGPHAAQDYYTDEYRQYRAIDDQRSMPLASKGSNNIYPKGALVLAMLKQYLGADRFWAGVHGYLTAHAHDVATSEDLRRAMEKAAGEPLDWFWDEWVYAAGHPELNVTAVYEPAAMALTLTVHQTQRDTLHADSAGLRFTVPDVFRMPVTIRVGTTDGDIVKRVQLDARDQVITIGGVATEPTMVVFDDSNAVLKELKFRQPTAWLATQLKRSPNLWNREWALAQLTRNPGDSAAVSAVTDALLHSDYWLTRAEAAAALQELPSPAAIAALVVALGDTSAGVRAAAVGSLGTIGGAAGAAHARALFASDTSYTVRAAALVAAVAGDPTKAHDLIVVGLRTPSYQEAIRNAALQSVAHLNDTTLVSAVDSLVHIGDLPSHVLAFLGGRGSARARDLLVQNLNDPRAAVRRWTLDAYGQTFARANRSLAASRLKAAIGTISYSDTKEAATELLAQLEKPE